MTATAFQGTSPSPIPRPIASYPASLQQLIKTLQVSTQFSPTQVAEVVREAAVTAEDLLPWASFDHPYTDSYGRKLVFHGGHFEVMAMSWLPGDFSAIHDHGFAQWGAVQCLGAAEHYQYTLLRDRLFIHTPRAAHYSPGQVRSVDHALIHQMGNAGDRPFLSLHVYGCCELKAAITGAARVFDLLEGSVQYTDGGVFFCLPDAEIRRRQYGLTGDRATSLMQYGLMRDRIHKMLAAQPATPPLRKKLQMLEHAIQQLS